MDSATAPATENNQIENSDGYAVGQPTGTATAEIETVVYTIQTEETETPSPLARIAEESFGKQSALGANHASDTAETLVLQQTGYGSAVAQLGEKFAMELVGQTALFSQPGSEEEGPKLKRKCLLDSPEDYSNEQQRRTARKYPDETATRESKADAEPAKATDPASHISQTKVAPGVKQKGAGTRVPTCQFHMIEQQDGGRVFTSRVLDTVAPHQAMSPYHCPICLHEQGLDSVDALWEHLYAKHATEYDCYRLKVTGCEEQKSVFLMFKTNRFPAGVGAQGNQTSEARKREAENRDAIEVPYLTGTEGYVSFGTMSPLSLTEFYMSWLPYEVKRKYNLQTDETWQGQVEDSDLCDLEDVETPMKQFVLVWNESCRQRRGPGPPPPMFSLAHQFAENHAEDVELEAFQAHCLEMWRSGHMGREQALQCVEKMAASKDSKEISS